MIDSIYISLSMCQFSDHCEHVVARYNDAEEEEEEDPSSSSVQKGISKESTSSSSTSTYSKMFDGMEEGETLADWLRKGDFTLAMSPGFLGSFAQIGALRAISEVNRYKCVCGVNDR